MADTITLRERIKKDQEFHKKWKQLTPGAQQELLEIEAGIRVPNFLNDAIFKKIFDPDEYSERLSRFISAILGKKVRVLHSLKNEGRPHSVYSKGIILDLVVQFEDGSIGNVEIQRYDIDFPSKRAACYSADLVTRQYAVRKDEKKSETDYDQIQPVYTIIIFEKSPASFKVSDQYHHHFEQHSNTGVELELLQYYEYICLDAFKKEKPHVAGELEKWLHFLTISDMETMRRFLHEEPSFQDVYHCAIMMTRDRKELMEIMSDFFEKEDIVASLNRTNESRIKRLEKELEKKNWELLELENTKNSELTAKDSQLREQEMLIKELKRQLKKAQNNK